MEKEIQTEEPVPQVRYVSMETVFPVAGAESIGEAIAKAREFLINRLKKNPQSLIWFVE